MNTFTISQLGQFSGIKPHTIRIWELRYNALTPYRSEGNTRYYDDLQLKRLLNIVSLVSYGYKVSDACIMKDEDLGRKLSELSTDSSLPIQAEYYISQLIKAGIGYDESSFEKLYMHCLLRYRQRDMYIKIIYPLLQRTGLMWASDQIPPATEHFISHIIRQKLSVAIDALPYPESNSPSWLCFLKEDEFHETGLLFSNYLIRSMGHKVIYLGSNVPFSSLQEAVKKTQPDHLLTFLVSKDSAEKNREFVKALSMHFRKTKIFIASGNETKKALPAGSHTIHLSSLEDLEQELQ